MYVPAALKYTAYAVALGFTVEMPAQPEPDPETLPQAFNLRDISVFNTENGWRVATWVPETAMFAPHSERFDTFKTLPKALREGKARARPRTEVDLNPLLPHLRAVLREMQDGNGAGNPYCKASVLAALLAIKDLTNFPGNSMDANNKPVLGGAL